MLSGVQAPSHLPLEGKPSVNCQSLPEGHFHGFRQEVNFVEAVDFGSFTKAKLTWKDGKKLDERTFLQLHG